MATVIPGEASETDDDNDNDYNGSKNCQQPDANEQNNRETRNWNLNDAQQRSPWSLHVDEKLEERWRLLASDTVKLAKQQAFVQRKQYENLKQNLSNMQHTLQVLFQVIFVENIDY
ncbi:unnamed protein product [Onchocerca ochengi]|uniref:Myb_CC_LHEQLE domain-containing protein n=2 Tax=Onchocerca TaxID=6281 RepID=A0A182EJI4_ONCOC|nr:unnamed protein product [Onchocerca ochengi]